MLHLYKVNSISQAYANDLRDLADEQKMLNARTIKLENVME
jgi:hypothetical protein